jgi:hypothetical protein
MHFRCYSPRSKEFKNYGGRGIKVCRRWHDINNFLADMGHPSDGMTLGRINNDGDYKPGNCRWETQEQQNENTRRNRYVTWQGRTQTVKFWAQELDADPSRIYERLRRGWTVERALTTPTPIGYEEGRAKHNASVKALWEANGRRYARNSARRTTRPATKPATTARPARRGRLRINTATRARILELRAEGLSCRAIADRTGASKSSVSYIVR